MTAITLANDYLIYLFPCNSCVHSRLRLCVPHTSSIEQPEHQLAIGMTPNETSYSNHNNNRTRDDSGAPRSTASTGQDTEARRVMQQMMVMRKPEAMIQTVAWAHVVFVTVNMNAHRLQMYAFAAKYMPLVLNVALEIMA